MGRTNEGADEYRRMMRVLRHVREQSGGSVAAAERAWQDLPAELLSPDAMRLILATVLQRQSADSAFLVWQAWSEGVYWDKAGGDRDTFWAPIVPVAAVAPDSCQIIGLATAGESMEGTTALPTLAGEISRCEDLCGFAACPPQDAGGAPSDGIDPIVYEVLLDCRGLDRRQSSDLIRGLVQWDTCLEPRDLDAGQWTWRHELRCDHADCDQSGVVGLFPEWF